MVDSRPRPANFADVEQHLLHEKADVIFAAFGFNESFAGKNGLEKFHTDLTAFVADLKSKAFNGKSAPQIVLVSPIANENVKGVAAADANNARIKVYADVIRDVAAEQKVGFADVFTATEQALSISGDDLTINGVHLTEEGYELFAKILYRGVFGEEPPDVNESMRETVVEATASKTSEHTVRDTITAPFNLGPVRVKR